jgi:hypothetical protein
MRICYYIILVAVGQSGSPLNLAYPPSPEPLWLPRGTLAPSAYRSQYGVATRTSSEQGWVAAFLSWAAQSGNFWAFSLLPFFILLAALQTGREKGNFPANIYTLF